MIVYAARRLLSGIFLLLALTFVTYVIFYTIPSNPGCQVVSCGPHSNTTPEQLAAANHRIGADEPVIVQYGKFLWRLVADWSLGYTFSSHVAVGGLLKEALPVTASIVLGGGIVLLLLALPLAMLGALRPRSWLDRAALLISLFGIALHPFLVGLVLRSAFSDHLHLAPYGGYCSLTPTDQPCSGPLDWTSHLVLPWFTFALFFLPLYVRMLRSRLLETMGEPHVLVARAKGASEVRVMRSHVLRTAMPPVIAMLAMDMGTAVTAAIYIETVYGMPGIGLLALHSLSGDIGGYDLPTIVGIVVVVALVIVVLNLVADIITAALDPRIRLRESTGLLRMPAPVARASDRMGRVVPERVRAGLVVAAALAIVGLLVYQHRPHPAHAATLPAERRHTIPLGWNQNVTFAGHVDVSARIQIGSVAVGPRTWLVRAKVTNTSKQPLDLVPYSNDPRVGNSGPSLLVPGDDPVYGVGLQVKPATVFDPPLPSALGPGDSWEGIFGGKGRIPRKTLIYIGFGLFQAKDDLPVGWNSGQSFRLP